jgi:hypothetical protein|tara:strand:- start:421 stop:549 length:129 start_codon:yes stop_codon:yes gene_type:complete
MNWLGAEAKIHWNHEEVKARRTSKIAAVKVQASFGIVSFAVA